MAYTNQDNIEDYLQRALSAEEISYLAILLPAVDEFIDNYTGQSFASGNDQTRYYDGNGMHHLPIDSFTSITSVQYVSHDSEGQETAQDTYTADDQYIAYPLNATVKNRLYRYGGSWPLGKKNIKVVGDSGYEDVPSSITHAATMLASGYLDTTKNLKRESIEGYSREFSEMTNDNEELLNSLGQYKTPLI